jgi:hypothetical protein
MKITHNGQEIDLSQNEDVKNAIAQAAINAANIEKQKLYAQLEAAKAKPAQQVGLTKEDVLAIMSQNTPPSPPPPPPPAQGMTQEHFLKLLNEKLPEVIKTAVAPMNEAITKLQSENLGEYRSRRAKEVFGTAADTTVNLIKGNTREEIDGSITALEALRNTWTPAPVVTPAPATQTPAPVVTPQVDTPPTGTPPPPPATGTPTLVTETLEERIKKMSPEEFQKNRTAILREMEQTMPTLD